MGIISNNSVIKKQGSNFKKLKKDELLKKAINVKKEDILEAQRLQLYKGMGNDDQKITPSYANPSYAKKKNSMNPNAGKGNPDLKLTGDLWESFVLNVTGSQYNITSTVDYFSELAQKYTTAFDLSKKSAQSIGVQNEYFSQIHKAINK